MAQFPHIETLRLILTWPTPEQIAQYHLDILGSRMFDTIVWEGPKDLDDLPSYWKECMIVNPQDFDQPLHVAIVEKASQRYIGGAALRPAEGHRSIIDIGYAIAPKFQGQGYGTEAVGVLVDEAFGRRQAERVFANVFVGNLASRRLLEKLGFSLEGVQRRAQLKRNQWLDVWLFATTRPDWVRRKNSLAHASELGF